MKKLSIRARLYANLLATILILFISVAAMFYTLDTLEKLEGVKDRVITISQKTLALRKHEKDYLNLEIKNPHYFKTGESIYLENFKREFGEIYQLLNQLKEEKFILNNELLPTLEKLEVIFKYYHQTFLTIEQDIFEMGFKDWGKMGELREAVHNVENIIDEHDLKPVYMVKMLMLRRHEKDFIIRKDLKYQQKLNDRIVTFRETLEQDEEILEDKKIAILQNLNDYEEKFNKVVEKSVKIGLTQNDGMLGDLRLNILEVEPEIELLTTKVEAIIAKSKRTSIFIVVLFVITGILLLLIFSIISIRGITRPINYLKSVLLSMKRGKLPGGKLKESSDEIGDMAHALNEYVDSLRETANFSLEIGKGNFDSNYKPLSGDDVLGQSLLVMRDSLREAAREETKRKKEDEQKNWASHGLAKFADISREYNNDLEKLSYTIISELVNYMDANQAGLFILNEENDADHYLELLTSYAYNRKKFQEKKIKPGEGLVGTCFLEKESIYMNQLPDNYINISSGLGYSNPKILLIVPMMVNDKVLGVIEMASFHEMEPYQIEFAEGVAETIASTISSMKVNMQTSKLLEESRGQSEKMAEQEEEMRQNMEELMATREEARRNEEEMKAKLDAIEKATYLIELCPEGTIMSANGKAGEILKEPLEKLKGKELEAAVNYRDNPGNVMEELWPRVLSGTPMKRNTLVKHVSGKYLDLQEIYAPVQNGTDKIKKVLLIGL
jgi:methyl-accepting chemotaxis protein